MPPLCPLPRQHKHQPVRAFAADNRHQSSRQWLGLCPVWRPLLRFGACIGLWLVSGSVSNWATWRPNRDICAVSTFADQRWELKRTYQRKRKISKHGKSSATEEASGTGEDRKRTKKMHAERGTGEAPDNTVNHVLWVHRESLFGKQAHWGTFPAMNFGEIWWRGCADAGKDGRETKNAAEAKDVSADLI